MLWVMGKTLCFYTETDSGRSAKTLTNFTLAANVP